MPERASCLTVRAGSAMIGKTLASVEIKQLIRCKVSVIMGQAPLMPFGRGGGPPGPGAGCLTALGAGCLTALGQAPDETQESQVLLHLY
jgi:hypothetical protein